RPRAARPRGPHRAPGPHGPRARLCDRSRRGALPPAHPGTRRGCQALAAGGAAVAGDGRRDPRGHAGPDELARTADRHRPGPAGFGRDEQRRPATIALGGEPMRANWLSRRARGRDKGFVEAGIAAGGALLVVGAVAGNGLAATVVDMTDGHTWLPGQDGRIVQVNPATGAPERRLVVAGDGSE